MLHWMVCLSPLFPNVTLEDLYETCVYLCYMTPLFANVTLEDLYDTCVWQCYIGGFVCL